MNLLRALRGFLVEAVRNLRRGPQASLLAIGSIAVSLLLVGFFHLIGRNLTLRAERFEAEARILVYAREEATRPDLDRLAARLAALPWVESVLRVTPAEALEELRRTAPEIVGLAAGTGGTGSGARPQDGPRLPTSFELRPRAATDGRSAVPGGRREELLALDPAVFVVDDDREWLAPLQGAATALRVLSLGLVGVLLGASLLTIGAVIRLKALLDGDEIGVLRLVGGTEFYIRGPFYAEGLILGAIGGLLALGALRAASWILARRLGGWPGVASLVGEFLPVEQSLGLVALGAAAGLVGAILSLGREEIGPIGEVP